jgi:hypothetical protein
MIAAIRLLAPRVLQVSAANEKLIVQRLTLDPPRLATARQAPNAELQPSDHLR